MIYTIRADSNTATNQVVPPGMVSDDGYGPGAAYQLPKSTSPLGQSPLKLLMPIIRYDWNTTKQRIATLSHKLVLELACCLLRPMVGAEATF